MDGLVPLDRLQVTVVVDNETDGLSPPCACCDASAAASDRAGKYTSEVSGWVSAIKSGAATEVDFRAICKAGHGLSLLLEAELDGQTRTLLFDGGPCPELWRGNATSLGLPVSAIEALVLSHWHIDHSVGLTGAARAISEARAADNGSEAGGRADVVVDLHPKRPHCRGLQLPNSPDTISFNKEPELAELELPGLEVQLHNEGHTLLGGAFFVSGFVPRTVEYESGNPSHVSQWVPGGPFEPDELVEDERYVAALVRGKGVAVFSACSHAGIINVMKDVQDKTGKPPYAVFGGFHLAPRDCAPRVAPTVADMVALQPALVVGGHCTGWQAKAALAAELRDRYMPSFVGSRFSIPAAASEA